MIAPLTVTGSISGVDFGVIVGAGILSCCAGVSDASLDTSFLGNGMRRGSLLGSFFRIVELIWDVAMGSDGRLSSPTSVVFCTLFVSRAAKHSGKGLLL